MVRNYYRAETYEARKSVAYLVRRARNRITARIESVFAEKFSDRDVTFAHWVALMWLRDDLGRTPGEICQSIGYDTGAFTRLLDQLEERGLIRRARSRKDRREVELSLTTKGRATVESIIPVVVECYNGLLSGFTRAEADMLVRLLTKLLTQLEPAKAEK